MILSLLEFVFCCKFLHRLQDAVRKVALIAATADPGKEPQLLEASMHALGNTVMNSSSVVRQQLLATLPWPRVRELLLAKSGPARLRAWHMVRNLAHSLDAAPFQVAVLEWSEHTLLDIITETIAGAFRPVITREPSIRPIYASKCQAW
jgi:hypothetical protein